MHIPFNSGQHNLALHRGLILLHKLLQMSDRGLHHFCALEHLGNDQFIVVKQSSNLGHSGHQRSIDNLQRAVFRQGFVQVRNQTFLGAFNNVRGKPFL
ncbi:hypothetical protein D3C75_914800 [compost metagenome]